MLDHHWTGGSLARRLLAVPVVLVLIQPPVAAAEGLQVNAQIGGQASALALDGSTLHLGIGTRLEVLDASRPGPPVLIGSSAPLPSPIAAIAVTNGYAFVADGASGLFILDVHNQAQPAQVAHMDLGGPAERVVVDGATVYVAANAAGLHILDLSDPTSPTEIGSYNAGFGVLDVSVAQGLAYVAVDDGGMSRGARIEVPHLRTLDVSDPSNPSELGTADVTAGGLTASLLLADPETGRVFQYASRFGASGCDTGSVHVIDVSDPSSPRNTSDLTGACNGGAIAGTGSLFAIAASVGDTVSVYRPDSSQVRTDLHSGLMASGLALGGTSLYVAGADLSSGQTQVRVFDAASGTLVSTYAETALAHAQGTAVAGREFLADRGRFSILDGTSILGEAPLPADSGPSGDWFADVLVNSPYAYVTEGHTLLTFNIADVSRPAQLDQQSLGVGTFGIGRSGRYLYVISALSPPRPGLQYQLAVLDLADPAHPKHVADWSDIGGLWNGLLVTGDRAYLSADRALNVLDLSDPLHPRLVGSAPFNDIGGERLAIFGTAVFVAGFGGVSVYDVSDPAAPQQLPTFGGDGGFVSSLDVSGATLYAAYWSSGGLRAYDITDPANPVLLGTNADIPNGSVAASVFGVDSTRVLTSTYSGLWDLAVTPTQSSPAASK